EEALQRQIGVASFSRRLSLGNQRASLPVGDRDDFDVSAADHAKLACEGGSVEVNSPFGQVLQRRRDLPVRDVRQFETGALEETRHDVVEGTGSSAPVELAGLRPSERDEVRKCVDLQ